MSDTAYGHSKVTDTFVTLLIKHSAMSYSSIRTCTAIDWHFTVCLLAMSQKTVMATFAYLMAVHLSKKHYTTSYCDTEFGF